MEMSRCPFESMENHGMMWTTHCEVPCICSSWVAQNVHITSFAFLKSPMMVIHDSVEFWYGIQHRSMGFITQSRVLHADWLMLDNNEKATSPKVEVDIKHSMSHQYKTKSSWLSQKKNLNHAVSETTRMVTVIIMALNPQKQSVRLASLLLSEFDPFCATFRLVAHDQPKGGAVNCMQKGSNLMETG